MKKFLLYLYSFFNQPSRVIARYYVNWSLYPLLPIIVLDWVGSYDFFYWPNWISVGFKIIHSNYLLLSLIGVLLSLAHFLIRQTGLIFSNDGVFHHFNSPKHYQFYFTINKILHKKLISYSKPSWSYLNYLASSFWLNSNPKNPKMHDPYMQFKRHLFNEMIKNHHYQGTYLRDLREDMIANNTGVLLLWLIEAFNEEPENEELKKIIDYLVYSDVLLRFRYLEIFKSLESHYSFAKPLPSSHNYNLFHLVLSSEQLTVEYLTHVTQRKEFDITYLDNENNSYFHCLALSQNRVVQFLVPLFDKINLSNEFILHQQNDYKQTLWDFLVRQNDKALMQDNWDKLQARLEREKLNNILVEQNHSSRPKKIKV